MSYWGNLRTVSRFFVLGAAVGCVLVLCFPPFGEAYSAYFEARAAPVLAADLPDWVLFLGIAFNNLVVMLVFYLATPFPVFLSLTRGVERLDSLTVFLAERFGFRAEREEVVQAFVLSEFIPRMASFWAGMYFYGLVFPYALIKSGFDHMVVLFLYLFPFEVLEVTAALLCLTYSLAFSEELKEGKGLSPEKLSGIVVEKVLSKETLILFLVAGFTVACAAFLEVFL